MTTPHEPTESSVDLQRAVHDAMVDLGWIPPTTEEEFADLEVRLQEEPVELPPELAAIQDPLDAPRFSGCGSPKTFPLPRSETQENLARVAREGGEIPPEVAERMQRDRAETEKNANGG